MSQAKPAAKGASDVDFVVVGSGAAGGVVAKELAVAGFRVVVLEQGPYLRPPDFTHDEVKIFNESVLVNDYKRQPNTFRKTDQEKAQVKPSVIYGRVVGGGTVHFTANYWRLRAQPPRAHRGHGFCRLAHHVRRSRAPLHQGGMGDRRFRPRGRKPV